MLKLYETEKIELSKSQKSIMQALLTDIHYFLENGLTKDQIILVIKELLNFIEK